MSSGSYRYGFNGQEKSDEIKGSGNSYTAEFWEYDARLGRRWNTEPLQAQYPSLSPYSVFNNNPILYKDPNGQDWEISTIIDSKGNKTVFIKLTAAVINNSSNNALNMNDFAANAAKQIKNIYSGKYKEVVYVQVNLANGLDNNSRNIINVPREIDVKIIIDVDIKVITSESQLNSKQHLVSVENDNDPKMSLKETAHVDQIGGKKIFVKESIASTVALGTNKQTIAHEAGHTLGLYHVTQRFASFWSGILGKNLPTYTNNKTTLESNVMGPFISNKAVRVTPTQAKAIQKNIRNEKVNK